ncbi:hypothetical protein ACP275_14G006200 [Erythranthe tilingii]
MRMMMMMTAGKEQEKSQLATEICELLSRATTCANLHHPFAMKSPFINWYLVLSVDENTDTCVIKKQYHKLALKLHPDKNKHSKAETAFKLVSEAYLCLSDTKRRAAFDSQRNSFSCIKCNTIPATNNHTDVKIQTPNQETFQRSNRIQRRMKDLRNKLREEATIIEKCLTANANASTREFGIRSEIPIFNPSDYQYKGYGYPQHRSTNHKNLEDLRSAFKTGNIFMQNKATNGSPVFQYRSEIASSMSRFANLTRDR